MGTSSKAATRRGPKRRFLIAGAATGAPEDAAMVAASDELSAAVSADGAPTIAAMSFRIASTEA